MRLRAKYLRRDRINMKTVILEKVSRLHRSGGGVVEALKAVDLHLEEGEFGSALRPIGLAASQVC